MIHRVSFEVEAPYVHTTGPVLSAFFDALREGRIVGARCDRCDRVVVPADDHCETCGATTSGATPVGPGGVVTAVTTDGVTTFGRIQLEGAGTALIHRLAPGVVAGARVQPRWAATRTGSIDDIELFEVEP